MTFSLEELQALNEPLDVKHVSERRQGSITLSYVEGWHVIAELNRIFGPDNWTRETVSMDILTSEGRTIGQSGTPGYGVSYSSKVKVAIKGVIKEGYGVGHGIDRDLGKAHESAIKEAETDAFKRAAMQFGWPLGLALYDKHKEHVALPARKKPGGVMRAAAATADTELAALEEKPKEPKPQNDLEAELGNFALLLKDVPDPQRLQDLMDEYDLVIQRAKTEAPHLWSTGEGLPARFIPLEARIEAKNKFFTAQANFT